MPASEAGGHWSDLRTKPGSADPVNPEGVESQCPPAKRVGIAANLTPTPKGLNLNGRLSQALSFIRPLTGSLFVFRCVYGGLASAVIDIESLRDSAWLDLNTKVDHFTESDQPRRR